MDSDWYNLWSGLTYDADVQLLTSSSMTRYDKDNKSTISQVTDLHESAPFSLDKDDWYDITTDLDIYTPLTTADILRLEWEAYDTDAGIELIGPLLDEINDSLKATLTKTVKKTTTTEESGKIGEIVYKKVEVVEESYKAINYEALAVYSALKFAASLEGLFFPDRDQPMGDFRILHDVRYDGDGVRYWGGNKPVPGEISTNFNRTAFWHDHQKETSKYAIKYRVTLLMR